MIFSGGIRTYECQGCAAKYDYYSVTSVVPITATVVLASVVWGRIALPFVQYKWLSLGVGIVIGIASFCLIYTAVDILTSAKIRRGICPKCGAKMEATGRGFFDTFIPNPWELAIYALTIALPFSVEAIL